MSSDVLNNTLTKSSVIVDRSVTGEIERRGDRDLQAVSLMAGRRISLISKVPMVIGARLRIRYSGISTMLQDLISAEPMMMTQALEKTATLSSDLRRAVPIT